MNKYLAKLNELNQVKQKNQTIEKIMQINLAIDSIREDINWFKENDWYISQKQAKQIKAIQDFVFSNETIDEVIEGD